MKLRNILITVAAAGMMFASTDRTGVIGYTEGDYTDYHTFAHKAANYNVAYTAGDDFTAVWNVDGTTWGFSSGGDDELVNMVWSNGTYGVSAGLNMPAGGDTTFDLGFGMELMGYDVGFSMDTAENGPMSLNARGKCNLWLFDTMTFGYHAATTADTGTDYTQLNIGMYKVNAVGANTNFMFGMGVGTDDMPNNNWVDPATLVKTNFSLETELADWCDIRVGYAKHFNMAAADGESTSVEAYSAGLGFDYGSTSLDMTISSDTLDDVVSNPLLYATGRNTDGLAASWTLSYSW